MIKCGQITHNTGSYKQALYSDVLYNKRSFNTFFGISYMAMVCSKWMIGTSLTWMLMGCSTQPHNPNDRFESYNRTVYRINDVADKVVLKPISQGYQAAMPEVGEQAVSNVFGNIGETVTFMNDVLQLKPKQAVQTLHRFVFNTTFGLGGIMNVTNTFRLAPKQKNDFGITLAHYGWRDSSYFMMPLLGPMTVRDGLGVGVDSFAYPLRYSSDVRMRNIMLGVGVVNQRASLLSLEKTFEQAALDPYVFQRDAYMQRRQYVIEQQSPSSVQSSPKATEDDTELSIQDMARQRRTE